MAIPRKAAPQIVVGQLAARWLIHRKGTDSQTDYGAVELQVAVEPAGAERHELSKTGLPHPIGSATQLATQLATGPTTPALPSDVEKWIIEALNAGWRLQTPGPIFYRGVEEERVTSERPLILKSMPPPFEFKRS